MAKLIDATDVLRRLMAAHDLTQAEVAEAARVTPVTANRWVNGKQRADAETLARAIRRLGDDPATYGIVLRKPLDGDGTDDAPEWFTERIDVLDVALRRENEELRESVARLGDALTVVLDRLDVLASRDV